MTTITLDKIIRNVLMQRKYPLHYYIEFLVYAKDCLRELTFDSLQVMNTKLLAINNFNQVDIPSDYQDYVFVGGQRGQNIFPLIETDTLSRLNSYDSNLNQQTFVDASANLSGEQVLVGLLPFSTWYTVHYNAYGENTGRYFGTAGGYTDTFSIIKERNQIQINEKIILDNLYISYISNGQNADAATTIDGYAQKTIEAYIMWQFKENNRTYGLGERDDAKKYFEQQQSMLRARKSDLTPERLKRIIQKNSIAANKN